LEELKPSELGESIEILPYARQKRLIKTGLATIEDSSITYSRVRYSDNIEDPEEQVRADLYLDLVEKYEYSADNAIEMEKFHKIGHPHKRSDAKIDILVKQPDSRPFMVIELKSPDDYERYMEMSIQTQLFNLAAVENQVHHTIKYLVYYTRIWEAGALIEKTVCIDYAKYQSFEDWDAAGRPNLRGIPKAYGIVRTPQFVKEGDPDLRIDVRRDELQRIRQGLHNILWGGGKYQNDLFFNLVGLFLVKIYDEKETAEGEPYIFQVFFEDGEQESADAVYARVNRQYFCALEEYLGYSAEQINRTKDIVFDAQKVRYVVEVLQGISFTVNKFDVIGDFFEGIVRGEFKQSKGQYLTHTNLIKFMVEGLDLGELAIELINSEKRLPYIIDPACGSGAFLIESMKRITQYVLANPDRIRRSLSVSEFKRASFPEYGRNAWANQFIYGIEINGDLAVATKVNMVGHGDGSANIEAKDALTPFESFSMGKLQIARRNEVYPKDVNEQFDVIMSNPPFSVTVDRDTARTFPDSYVQGENILSRLRNDEELEVATELLFIERYYQLLRPGGRLAVVLPESVFDTSSTRDIRLFLFKYFRILGIISLPSEAFAPFTTTKTNILFAEKKIIEEIHEWEEKWQQYVNEYDQLKRRISMYLKQPTLHSKLVEIQKRFARRVDLVISAQDMNEIATTVIEFAQENRNAANLTERVGECLISLYENLPDEHRNIFMDTIGRKKSLLPSVEEYQQLVRSKEELIDLLKELLGDFFDESHKSLTIDELTEEYSEELKYADEDWWVFQRVCSELPSYNMVLSHANEIGYKRGVRGEENRPNDLFSTSEDLIFVNREAPETILDEFHANTNWRSISGT